jgi:hypothetical protein
MIKYLFVTINSIALFFYSLFFDGGAVTLNGNFPSNMKPGTEAVIDLVVNKGTMGGFAKLQVEVPEGFTVAEVDSKGGTFSFATGMAKWIWTGVPSDAEFTVKFKLQVDASVNGTKTIAAKYSYVENNNKQVSEMAPAEIIVGDGSVAAVTETKAPETKTEAPAETKTTEQPVANTETKTSEPITNPVSSNEPNSNVSAVRTVAAGGTPNEWNVNVVIKKAGIKGFARYSDVLPEGFTAKPGKTAGSSFSVADGKIKFVWVNVPTTDDIDISYTLAGNGEATLNGEFSYLENNQSKSYKLSPEKITGAVAVNNPPVETKTETAVSPTETKTTETPSVAVTETKTEAPVTPTETKTETKTETRTETPVETNTARAGSVAYCVQIGAYQSSNVTASQLSKKYGFSESVRSEMADGFTKFLIGKHGEYKEARNHRETARGKGVNGAFVAAYNGPKRITVQEALMISNPKWYK